jgi:N-acetylmuramoyl-L-alanine amidase
MNVLATLSVLVLPLLQMDHNAYAEAFSTQGTVIADKLNVREAADNSSKIIGQVHQGDTVEIIQTKNNWDEIKLSNNQTGWIYNAYLTPAENIGATVEAMVLRVHEKPNLSSKVVGKLKLGTKITVHEEKGGWAKIVSTSGVQGWVYEYYITKDAPSEQPVSVTHNKPAGEKAVASDTTEKNHLSQPSPAPDVDMTAQSMKTALIQNSQGPLKGKTIVLDPGHGGKDDGTTSIVGTHEKSLTLSTAQAVEQKLENAGAIVHMTRTDDTYIPLQQRADLSNQNHADAFISFHYNWSDDPSINGLTDFYYQTLKDSPLASDIIKEVASTTGLKNDGTRFDDLEVLRNNSQPSTLIELGFLSNKQDDSVIETSAYPNTVAQGVYQGLLDYFSNKK